MSTSAIGAVGASESSGFFQDGRFVFDTPLGNETRIGPVGENPSHRLTHAGSTATPSMFIGIASSGMSSRRPVAVDGSSTSYAALGQGNKQPCPPSGLQRLGMSPSPPHAA